MASAENQITQSFKNQFLISLPNLKGDYFEKSISLMIEHNEEGAFGLIINRPLEKDISELFSGVKHNCPVLLGGPVETERVFFLHPKGDEFDETLNLSDEIALTTSPDIIDAMYANEAPEKMLAILGYAGWGAEQLEHELADDIWLLAPSKGSIVFNTPYDQRANEAASLLGVDLNLMPNKAGHD